MKYYKPGFTLLELLISAGLLAGLSVLLLFSLSGIINANAQHNAVVKSNIQGELAMRQITDALQRAVYFQVLRNYDHPDSQIIIETPHRNSAGIAVADQYDLSLYCAPLGSGQLMLYRLDAVPFVTSTTTTYATCSSAIQAFSYAPALVTTTKITDSNVKVIAFDARQVAASVFNSAVTPKDTFPARSSASTSSSFPAVRIVLTTRYDVSSGGVDRAGRQFTDSLPQVQNATVIPENLVNGSIPEQIVNGL